MFAIMKKVRGMGKSEDRNKSSIEVPSGKSEADLIKDKIKKFTTALNSLAFDLHDDSCFYNRYYGKSEKKRINACDTYGKGIDIDPILLVDTTIFGKADRGLMFCSQGIYLCESQISSSKYLPYEALLGCKFKVRDGSFCVDHKRYDFAASSIMKKLKPVIMLMNSHLTD